MGGSHAITGPGFFLGTFGPLFLWTLGMSCSACSDRQDTPSAKFYSGPKNSCRKNTDCEEGICDPDRSMCLRQDDLSDITYLVRVAPKNQRPELFELSLTGNRQLLTLKKKADVAIAMYKVDIEELEDGGVREERKEVSLNGRILATDPRWQILDNSPPPVSKQIALSIPELRLSLSPGIERYRMEIVPEGQTYAHQYLDNVTVEAVLDNVDSESESDTALDIQTIDFRVYPPIATLKGKIQRGTQASPGLTVKLIDPSNGRILSTEAVTGCMNDESEGTLCGDFDLEMPFDDKPYFLKISKPGEPRYPTVLRKDEDAPVNSVGRKVFTLPVLPVPLRFRATVERSASPPDGIPGCEVVFESDAEGIGGGQVTTTAITNHTGALTSPYSTPNTAEDTEGWENGPGIYLYPGKYKITVIPPAAVPGAAVDYGLIEETREIEDPGDAIIEDVVFSLPYRTRVQVPVTAGGIPIPGAVVESSPIGHPSPYARRSYSFAEDDGYHTIWLDPGRHILTAQVPPESGYAFSFRLIDISPDRRLETEPDPIEIDDMKGMIPHLIELRVTSEDPDVDMGNAVLEWYQLLEDAGSAQLVARSLTDASGNADVLLPPPAALGGK